MAAVPRVVVQGCGVTGLTVALALARRGNTSTIVLDRRASSAALGGSVWLGPRALDVVRELGPELESSVRAAGSATSAFTVANGAGRAYATVPLAGLGMTYASLVQLLETEYVRVCRRRPLYGSGVARVLGDDVGDALLLQPSGRAGQRAMRCDALVAADGVESPLRALVGPTLAPSVPTRVAHWAVTLPLDVSGDAAAAVHEQWAAGRRLIVWPCGNGQWSAVGVTVASATSMGASRRPLRQFHEEFAPFFDGPLARQLFAAMLAAPSDVTAAVRVSMRVTALHAAVPSPLAVVLAGDAVHGCSLSAAWGVSLAFEDGYTLAHHGLSSRAAMVKWEQSRRERWAMALKEARAEDQLQLAGRGRLREGLRALALRWGGNRMLRQRLARVHEAPIDGLGGAKP